MNKANRNFTLIDHTADIGILVQGTNLKELFQNAGEALLQIMLKGDHGRQTLMQSLSVSGSDYADLMVRWLGEILYLFQGEKRIVNAIRIQDIQPYQLMAQMETVAFDPMFHKIIYEIKAVTYHQIEVIQKDKQWQARVIFDI